jgi:putative flippase GtrA
MKLRTQLLRYVIVGLISNLLAFLAYLLLSHTLMGHKAAMSLVYWLAVMQSFYFNRSWSFQHAGRWSSTFWKYVSAYLIGYLVNMLALLVAVDWLGFAHQWVQGGMIFATAALLFVLQRYWVFAAVPRAG